MKKLLYPLFGAAVIGGYAVLVLTGTDPASASEDRRVMPPEARASGAYRSMPFFWSSGGFSGGK